MLSRATIALRFLVLFLLLMAACGTSADLEAEAKPTATATPVVAPTSTPLPAPTATAIPIPTAFPTPLPTEPPTPGPTPIPSPTPTPTVSPDAVTPEDDEPEFPPLPDRPDKALGLMITANGYVVPLLGGEPGAWQVGTPCNHGAVVADGIRVTAATVLIDPGHGGDEIGAVGPTGLRESQVNLDISFRLQAWLREQGVEAALTRTDDYYVAIAARAEMAHAIQPELMISIHHNDVPGIENSDVPGVSVFYQSNSVEAERLGGIVQEELLTMMADFTDVQWVGGDIGGARWRLSPEGEDFYGVLRRTAPIVTVLSEAMYLSNPEEEALLYRDEVRQQEAEVLGKAILRWLTTDDAGSGVVPGDTLAPWPGANTGTVDACPEPILE